VDKTVPQPNDFNHGFPFKPSDALVTTTGECLTATGELGAEVRAERCDTHAPAQESWIPYGDRMRTSPDGPCIAAGSDSQGPPVLADCQLHEEAAYFRMARAQWTTPTRCVAPAMLPADAKIPLRTEPCGPAGNASQSWDFEILSVVSDGYYARIRFGDSDYCASLDNPNPLNADILQLEECSTSLSATDPQIFYLNGHQIWNNGTGMIWQYPDGAIYIDGARSETWLISGPLENGAGLALAKRADGLFISTLGAEPTPEQVFDFHCF